MISCTLQGEEKECLTFQLVIHADLSWAEEYRRSTSVLIGVYIQMFESPPLRTCECYMYSSDKKPSAPPSYTGSGPTGKGSVVTPQEK